MMIGRQRGGYGKALGDVALAGNDTVDNQMRQLVSEGFKRRGYAIDSAPNASSSVSVVIQQFWSWFTPGFWSVDFEAKIRSELTVTNQSKTAQVWVAGYGKNSGQVGSDANWKLAYARAYSDFLKNLDTVLAGLGM